MPNIIKKTKLNPEESEKINLTFARLNLQWWLNRNKNDKNKDHSIQVQFMKHRLERISGKRVKIKGE